MAITINGDGSITGISVGGLPDGIVDADMIAADAVTAAKVAFKGFTSYAIICDQKTQNTAGGTFTDGAWQTRDLNTEIADPDDIVSISSNQFTLQAGSYLISAQAPCFGINYNLTRLQNITDSSTEAYGESAYARNASGDINTYLATLIARVVITGAKTFELQHKGSTTRATNGLGVASDQGVEKYTRIEIYKEA